MEFRPCVVLDLECTCWDWNDPDKQFHEIIEIGAVMLHADLSIARVVRFYVQPVVNPMLTNYCKQLTGIDQLTIDHAARFVDVLPIFTEWVGDVSLMCSWGEFDDKHFRGECARHNLQYPFKEHINIKHMYLDKLKRTKGGLQKACRVLNIPFEGTPHCGMHDAIMAAKIFKMLSETSAFQK